MASALWFCGHCGDGPFTTGIQRSCNSCGRNKGPAALDADMDANITIPRQIIGRRHGYITTPLSSNRSNIGNDEPENDIAVEGDSIVPPQSTDGNIAITNGILAPVEHRNSPECTSLSNPNAKLSLKPVEITMQNNLNSTTAAISLQTLSGNKTSQIDGQKCRVWLRFRGNLTPCTILFSVGILVVVISLFVALYWAIAWKDPQTGFTMMTGIVMGEIMVAVLVKVVHRDCQCFSRTAEALGELVV
ncbi:hypothetical protein N431DRAFT_468243 [Stipitochalara longipes BDJ]|nr:hypothetical protein N431DRAFT_468243 [Stipitochalara longipes BDJ]